MSTNYINKCRKYGYSVEARLLPLLRKAFGDTLAKSEGRYTFYDFINDDFMIELKGRKCNYKTYDTTMISKSKIDKMLKCDKEPVLVFSFQDGNYYTFVDECLITKWAISEYRGVLYYYIPINYLINLEHLLNNQEATKDQKTVEISDISPFALAGTVDIN